MMTEGGGVPWWAAYPLLLLGMGCIGVATRFVIHRWMERAMGGRGVEHAASISGKSAQTSPVADDKASDTRR